MSGNNNRGGTLPRKPKGGQAGGNDCLTITFDTPLHSPDEDILKTVTKGTELEVALDGQRVVVRTDDGSIVGSIVHEKLPSLARCLRNGESFIAIVLTKYGGNCSVKIKHA